MHPEGVVYAATAIGFPRSCGFACCSIEAKQELRLICMTEEGEELKDKIKVLLYLKFIKTVLKQILRKMAHRDRKMVIDSRYLKLVIPNFYFLISITNL